ncbi:MAG TPA: PEGA domain-containing protein [Candidatus Angelobacter sp.]|jgi:hypothetical protein|nr:PEGA domain-containing protein [Candidatus Angelobacter sp.]
MRIACRPCVLVLCILLATYALAEGSWDRVRYCGGTVQSDVDPSDWNNHLNISLEHIVLELNDGTKVDIPAKSVTGLSYGQQAHGRISAISKVKVQASESESVIFGLRRTRLHFIGIEYRTPDGKSSGLLLQGNKENYRAILKALEVGTGASVAALEKDREYLTESSPPVKEPKPPKPVDQPKPVITKPADQPKTPAVTATNSAPGKPIKTGTVSISSSPRFATITVDGAIMGSTPSTLKLPPGEHSIALSLGGYKDWVTSITVEVGNTVPVKADLEKQ